MMLAVPHYLADTSALLELTKGRQAEVRPRAFTKLVQDGSLWIPAAVAREIRRRDDKLKEWLDRHPECIVQETDQNVAELTRIALQYEDELRYSANGADPSVVAMGIYYRDSRVVVTNDAGIQVACYEEGIPFLTAAAFRVRARL